ncbi:hypothetical protein [Bacillus mycoides]|nr:hypothetical protein [Bacillus mycoides]
MKIVNRWTKRFKDGFVKCRELDKEYKRIDSNIKEGSATRWILKQ